MARAGFSGLEPELLARVLVRIAGARLGSRDGRIQGIEQGAVR